MKSNIKQYEVPVEQLRWHCDPNSLDIKSTNDIHPSRDIIGQERALRALRLGLEIHNAGYNVFVTGYSGTGRMTTIKRLLAEFEGKQVPLKDQCYVHNIKYPDAPVLVTLPAGQGVQLRSDMDRLLQELIKIIPTALESQRYQDKRRGVLEHFQDRQRSVLRDFEKKVKEKGFEVIQVQVASGVQPEIAPVVGNQPVSFDQLDTLIQQGKITREDVEQKIQDRMLLEKAMEVMLREMRNIDRKAKDSIEELTKKHFQPIAKLHVEEIRTKYQNEKLHKHLESVIEHVVNNLHKFRPQDGENQPAGTDGAEQSEQDSFIEFRVNVVLDNSETKGIPIVIETNPKYKNLFGTIEREVDRNGVWRTDFTMIKSGSMLKADGGYIVVNALDALVEPGVWQTLKRTLRNGLLEIQSMESGLFGMNSALKPEPVEIGVKVIMIGDAYIYFLLYEQDDDFKKIFKVRADFDIEMPKQDDSINRYVSFIKMICDEDKLCSFDASGVAAVIEYGTRLAGRQNKLSTRFNVIADVLREASYWASKENGAMANASHVWRAIDERIERVNLIEEKIQDMIIDGSIMIDSDGWAVGQVNGLSVYDLGEYAFGKPTRITAKTSLGRDGIINIEREAEMSGPTHDKGMLILNGYMHSTYAMNKPLVMTASIAFEQSYSGVDGDSASSTEIYALLSSLSNLPLRQDIAVTGSVNQKGEIQPIGGVNQKIEGFFDVCKARGLTGKQGVLIPHQNIPELMLRRDVIEAVNAGKFRIYSVKTIDEGIEILTGKKAGTKNKKHLFTKGSVHFLVDKTLTKYARRWKELSA
ncbi:MAG: AAA family ATPase [Ignavibacteriae bacterium]|nr:AAA family ATPase [Ignavibacteriota bacterium]